MSTATRTRTAAGPGFRSLLDERILVAERRVDHVVGEVERRRLEHLIGRDLASHLMRRMADRDGSAPLGLDRPVDRGPHGEPLFPSGVVGSIAHSAGLVAAAVATRRSGVLALGVDVHPATPLPGDVGDIVGGVRELRHAPALVGRGMATSVLFSAKESVFKAWFPLTGSWLEFEDVSVRLRDDGTFRVQHPATPALWHGLWQISDGMIRTAATLTWHEF
jgi:4'-phosphopantetheinyl transferase EntD